MRKFFQVLSATALAVVAIASPKSAQALDLSGYVDTVGAFSYTAKDWVTTPLVGPPPVGHDAFTVSPGFIGGVDVGNGAAVPGVTAGKDFTFAAAEVKLHGTQEFGDVATAVFSLSFGSAVLGGSSLGGGFTYDIQQAYVALNWDALEFKMGRFYAPIGIESVDANARANITMGTVFAGLEPFYLTGFQVTYGPDEGPGFFLFVSNDAFEGNLNSQSAGTDEDVALGAGVTFATDDLSATLQYNVDWTAAGKNFQDAYQLFDLSLLMENDTMLAGVNTNFSAINVGTVDFFIYGLQLIGGVKMDDLTVGTRAEWVMFIDDPTGTGDAHLISIAPFVTYSITDGVFARAEYRADIVDMDKAGVGVGTGAERSHQQVISVQLNASFE